MSIFRTVVIVSLLSLSTTFAQAETGGQNPKKTAIVGSWLVSLADGNQALVTYGVEGAYTASVQTEVSLSLNEGLTAQHGVWRHLGGRTFGVTSLGILYNLTTGQLNGYLRVRAVLTLDRSGTQMSATDNVEILDADGNVDKAYPPGESHYTRIQFEPID